jgi:transposase
MMNLPVFVGLDYHQQSVQVCVMDTSGKVLVNRKCPNDWHAVAAAVPSGSGAVQAAIEACGGAADLADELVEHARWSVDIAHPGYVHRIKQSPDKTDYTDARLLADLERVGYLPKVWHAPERIRELRRLVRYRQQLSAEHRSVKLRIRALLRDHRLTFQDATAWTKAWLSWVAQTPELPEESRWIMDQHLAQLADVKKRMRVVEERLARVAQDDRLIAELLPIPGVGLITAVTIRAEIGRFDRFRNGKQLSRFCGLSPRNASSGQRQADAGLIKAGNTELRRVLTQAAHRLMRYEPRWQTLACQLKQRGKPVPLVVAAVANRWMRTLYHQLRSYGLAA